MGSLVSVIWDAATKVIPAPIRLLLEKYGSKWLCESIQSIPYIGPQICEIIDDKPVWGKNEKWLQVAITIIAALVLLVVFGGPLLIGLNLFEKIPQLIEQLGSLLFIPFTWAYNLFVFLKGYLIMFNEWAAKETSTFPELYYALEVTLFTLGITDLIKELSDWAFSQPLTSYFWRTYFFLETPINWLQKAWDDLFPSYWNPLKWISWIPASMAKITLFFITMIINVLNPMEWLRKINQDF